MLVMGERDCLTASSILAAIWLRDFMESTLVETIGHITCFEMLLANQDPDLSRFLASVDSYQPYFCISWIITWLSHNYHSRDKAARVS